MDHSDSATVGLSQELDHPDHSDKYVEVYYTESKKGPSTIWFLRFSSSEKLQEHPIKTCKNSLKTALRFLIKTTKKP